MEENELTALIDLLEDPDDGIYEQIKRKILDIGPPIVQHLESAWELSDHGVVFRNRVEDLLHTIHLETVHTELKDWGLSEEQDLLTGALTICKYRYTELDVVQVTSKLQALRQDIWLELGDGLTAFEKVRIVNHFLFEVHGFNGNKENYLAPQNSFLNEVISTKKGNPLTLSILYQLVAEQLGLPIAGVNLPNHFILAYMEEGSAVKTEERVLFYINPFSKGDILTTKEIDQFLARLKIKPASSFYTPCTPKDMIVRVLSNLANSYRKADDMERLSDIEFLRSALPSDS